MKYLKIFLKAFVFFILICILAKSWHLLTDGFRVDKINQELTNSVEDIDNYNEIKTVLNQKFKYLSKGCQTYVFQSEDNDYVIKFIRYHRYKISFWKSIFNYNKNLKQSYKSKLLKDSLNSYEFAHKYLKDETAIVYVHLSKTNHLNKKIQIFDRLNNKYIIDLDNTGFLIQKKVKSFQKALNKNKNNDIELKRLTDAFLQTTKSIYLKGFNNDDYNCIKNAGVLDNKVVHSDVGSFLEKNLKEKQVFEEEFIHFVRYFKKWANKNAPFLVNYVDQEIRKMSSDL